MVFKQCVNILVSIITKMPIMFDIVGFPSKVYRIFVEAQRKQHLHAVAQATAALATAKRQVKANNILLKNELEVAKQQVEVAKQQVKVDNVQVMEDKRQAKNELEETKQQIKEEKLLAKNEKEASASERKKAMEEGSAVKKALALKKRDFKAENKNHQAYGINAEASYDADYAVFVAKRNLRLANSAKKALQYTHMTPVVNATLMYNREVSMAAVEIPSM